MKVSKEKKAQLLEFLRKTPIIEIATAKSGISKATLYNWKKEDPDFALAVDEAMGSGKDFVSDLAEGKLISSIQSNNLSAAIFWLKSHRKDYHSHLELSGEIRTIREKMTDEEWEFLQETLRLSGFKPEEFEIGKDHQSDGQTINNEQEKHE